MGNELVSVLMVNYNHEDTIGETIESVLGQGYQNMQFIIVDDGSTDSSCRVIEGYKDERIELYKLEKNRHICYATNYGFQKVKGEFLARIDSDDIWYPDKLERQMDFLRSNPDRDICFSWIDLIDETGRNINEECREMVGLFEASFRGQSDCLHTFYFLGNCLSHPSVLMRTGIMRETGDFDLGYMQSHDFDYWVRIAKKYPIYVMQERLLAMRRFIHENSEVENNSKTYGPNVIRYENEAANIKRHFFEDMEDELFIRTFRQDFKNPESNTKEELECEKIFLLCKTCPELQNILPTGLDNFLELYPKYAEILKQKFDFTVHDFYDFTGNRVYHNEREENAKRREQECLKEELQKVHKECERLKMQIEAYENSKSWKATAPFRKIKAVWKK